MIWGLTTSTFTLFHVLLSLIGIGTGFIVAYGLLAGKRLDGWTAIFLFTTVATSVTGFAFPFEHLLPSHIIGMLSLFVLAIATLARTHSTWRGPGVGSTWFAPWLLST